MNGALPLAKAPTIEIEVFAGGKTFDPFAVALDDKLLGMT